MDGMLCDKKIRVLRNQVKVNRLNCFMINRLLRNSFSEVFWTVADLKMLEKCKVTEAYSEFCQTPKMERFAEIVNGYQSLTISIFYQKLHFKCLAGF